MSSTSGSYPKTTLTWSKNNLSYVVISYYGNAIVGTTNISSQITSGKQTGTSWTSNDMSFNALYTFTMTPYNSAGSSGISKTFVVDTTPSITGCYMGSVSPYNTQIQWYGTYYYVRVYRKIIYPYTTDYIEMSPNTKIYNMPFTDTDICGNTTYNYYIQPYDANNNQYAASNTLTVNTPPQAATDLSAIFYDLSSIKVSFTLAKNSYISNYYYQLNAVYNGVTTSVSGTSSPLWVKGLLDTTTYTCYILNYVDGALSNTSSQYLFSTEATKKVYINGIVDSSFVNGFTVYGFKSTTTTSSITISGYGGSTLYIFAVGGGAGASACNQTCAGGGGGGGVVSTSIVIPDSITITCKVGKGGPGGTSQTDGSLYNGGNTIISFSSPIYSSITSYGGGGGSGYGGKPGGGGCGGGQSRDANNSSYGYAYIVDSSYNVISSAVSGNPGSQGYSTNNTGIGCGGSGAGSVGTNSQNGSTGGIGVKPSTVFGGYSSYYFGGGGGGGSYNGNGGLGGGGGSGTNGTTTGGAGYNPGSGGSSNGGGGSGGANTGGGGGGGYNIASNRNGGSGGSGIVLISLYTS